MGMIVTIDETGLRQDAKYVNTTEKLNIIVTTMKEIAEHVSLVISGTGLDAITTTVNTNQGAIKIQMKPWTVDVVLSLPYLRFNEVAKKKIRNIALFQQLCTNPRTASFLQKSLLLLLDYWEDDALIEAVVTQVALEYIWANGLKKCTRAQRRLIAKLVLEQLENVSKKSPHYETIGTDVDDRIYSCCASLVDVHVDSLVN